MGARAALLGGCFRLIAGQFLNQIGINAGLARALILHRIAHTIAINPVFRGFVEQALLNRIGLFFA